MTGDGEGSAAIVGMAAVFPGASTLDEFWSNILGEVDATGPVPADRIDPVYLELSDSAVDRFYCRRGGFIDTQAIVDPVALGVMPATVDQTEPDQLLSLVLAARAMADAGGEALAAHLDRTAVVVGRGGYLTPGLARLDQRVRTSEQLVQVLRTLLPAMPEAERAEVKAAFVRRLGEDRADAAIDLVPNLVASRVANRLDLHGPAYTVDAACASALVAVDHGLTELRSGRSDVVLAGGVHVCQDVTLWSVFTQIGALSRSGEIRPFDRRADGLLIGEGGGMVVLRRLEDAEREGTRIYAVVRGSGVASDGRSTSLMRPSAKGQLAALERAWAMAAIEPGCVGLIEAHGTATPVGDATELETISRFFGTAAPGRRIGLGSVKSMIGHTMPAAGAAGLVKAVLAVHHGVLPPTLHCEEPHDLVSKGPCSLVEHADAWSAANGRRVAVVNAFGFGGINAHLVIEAHGGSGCASAVRPPSARRPEVRQSAGAPEGALLLAAASPGELGELLAAWRSGGRTALEDGGGTARGIARLALMNPSEERLALAARVVERQKPWRGRSDLWFSPRGLADQGGRMAFLFPGVEPTFAPRLDDVAEHFGWPVPDVLPGDAGSDLEGLGRAIVAAGRLLHAAAQAVGLTPDVVAGQSIGEWSGMIATEMIPADEVDDFIARIQPGSLEVPGVEFLALGAPLRVAEELMADLAELEISHDNCPHQTIVCGPSEQIAELRSRTVQARVLHQVLPFRSGFHTAMFAPYLAPFRAALDRLPLQVPVVPLWSATTCAPYPDDPDEVRRLALAHLVQRVRFRELTTALRDEGVRLFVQVGVGSLPGLVEDTLAGDDVLAVGLNVARRSGMAQLRRAVAALWVEGVEGLLLDRVGLAPPNPGPPSPPAPVGVTGGSVGVTGGSGTLRPLPLATPMVRLGPWSGSSATPPGAGTSTPSSSPGGSSAPKAAGSLGAVDRELAALHEELATSSELVARAWAHGAVERPPRSDGVPRAGRVVRQVTLSTHSAPELADHCFYRQPPGWSVMADRFPVVPMTALVEMMCETASEVVPGWVPVEVTDIRAVRWLAVEPPVTVTVRGQKLGGSGTRTQVRVSVDDYARATVLMAPGYGAAPPPVTLPLVAPEPALVTAEALYRDRWMFHGPSYQGVVDVGPIDATGIDGRIRVGGASGMLLDNAGQLMGLWVMLRHDRDRLALPTAIERIELFGPMPDQEEVVSASVRVTHVDAVSVRADMELSHGRRVWARVHGWQDRRFESDDVIWPVLIWPESETLARPMDGGWVLVEEGWGSSAARELMMRRYLSQEEQARYATFNPRVQRLFLLGRIAAKDAARRWLWEQGAGPVWPVEITVENDATGRPLLRAPCEPTLHVSISHTQWLGVALVDDGAPVGIDVERVEERSEAFASTAFEPNELSLLLEGAEPGTRSRVLTAAWTAKEAVAKMRGTGLGGRPKDFRITGRETGTLTVDDVRVRTFLCDSVVVAWTDGPAG